MCRTDQECVKSCLDGRPEAFRHVVGRYQGALLSYLTGRLGDADQAEEAAQETFGRAYFALDKLKRPESLFSWLVGIASRVAREMQRARRIALEASEPICTTCSAASFVA